MLHVTIIGIFSVMLIFIIYLSITILGFYRHYMYYHYSIAFLSATVLIRVLHLYFPHEAFGVAYYISGLFTIIVFVYSYYSGERTIRGMSNTQETWCAYFNRCPCKCLFGLCQEIKARKDFRQKHQKSCSFFQLKQS